MNKFVVVIPARYESKRLPGKPLINLEGKSMILRTYEQCVRAVNANLVYVATDNEQIKSHCEKNNIQVVMTPSTCLTGTDRIAEFAKQVEAKTYINVQGDEPLMNPEDILRIVNFAKQFPDEIINGYAPVLSKEQYNSLTIPKLVFRPDGRLLYMSRSPVPGNKEDEFRKAWRQICVYAFPNKALLDFASLTDKTTLEKEEDIEILRFLELGHEVRMIELSSDSIAVDTPEDAERVRDILEKTEI
jgi:3-deoxy-manno-octulosonate cytidylyltransferase (CMP-KDO synthetase)